MKWFIIYLDLVFSVFHVLILVLAMMIFYHGGKVTMTCLALSGLRPDDNCVGEAHIMTKP
jgi:hypothetical protein